MIPDNERLLHHADSQLCVYQSWVNHNNNNQMLRINYDRKKRLKKILFSMLCVLCLIFSLLGAPYTRSLLTRPRVKKSQKHRQSRLKTLRFQKHKLLETADISK